MSSASTLMSEEWHAGRAVPWAVTTCESNIRCGICGRSSIPSTSLVFLYISTVFIKLVIRFEDRVVSCITVSRRVWPALWLNMTIGDGDLETVHISLIRAPVYLWTMDMSTYISIYGIRWCSILETSIGISEVVLQKHSFNAIILGLLLNVNVYYKATPANVDDVAERASEGVRSDDCDWGGWSSSLSRGEEW